MLASISNTSAEASTVLGAATPKARSLYVFKRAVGVAKSLCDDDRNVRHDCVLY